MNPPMRRRLLPLLATALWIALAVPSIALADDPAADPPLKAVGAPDGSAIAAAAVAVLAVVGLVVAAIIVARRRAGGRLEPAVPEAWWTCPACQSLNAGSMPRCYACQAARPSDVEPDAPVPRGEP